MAPSLPEVKGAANLLQPPGRAEDFRMRGSLTFPALKRFSLRPGKIPWRPTHFLTFTGAVGNLAGAALRKHFRALYAMTKLALYLTGARRVGLTPGALKVGAIRVADPDPVGSGVFAWIRIQIRIRFSNISGSGFQISLDPDPVLKFLLIRIRIWL